MSLKYEWEAGESVRGRCTLRETGLAIADFEERKRPPVQGYDQPPESEKGKEADSALQILERMQRS